MSQTHHFQAETQQLLDILIHSLYTEREIFLRELISNASDALSRVQFEELTNAELHGAGTPYEIRLLVDEENGTLTVRDTGIGMTADEMVANLGTIARSGAKHFLQSIKDAPASDTAQAIIGQFGVGFYSVFMVAESVRVVSRSARPDAHAAVWTADGGTTYTLGEADKDTRGTDIIIKLKEDARDFLDAHTLRETVKRHSDFIAFPIYFGDEDTPINQQTALWRKAVKDISEEDYRQFYQMMTFDFGEPTYRQHIRADVPMQFYALLYAPSSAQPSPFALRKEAGLKLYARKVLIQDYCRDLLPEYLSFMQGVVDSEDLPLNVSRESVKNNRIMANLKSTITKRVLSDLKRMANNDRDGYLKFYAQFGRYIKQGLAIAPQDRDDLQDLLFFNTSLDDTPDTWYSLSDVVARMVEGQRELYYIVADDFASASRSPHLEPFRARGIEVLYFCDHVDALIPMSISEYRGYKLRGIDDATIDLTDVGTLKEATPPAEALPQDSEAALLERVKAILGERVKGVQASKSLVGSAARLVSDDDGNNRHIFRINRLLDRSYDLPIKTLELNMRHPLLHNLAGMVAREGQEGVVQMVVEQLFETALLQEGIHPDPASMADRLTRLMELATS
jgi:molecular chaperone HtpG